VAVAAKLYQLEERRDQRRAIELDAKVHQPKGPALDALISDVSDFGFRAELDHALGIGDIVGLEVPRIGLIEAVVVRRVGREYGCEFLRPIDGAVVVTASEARAADAAPAPPASADQLHPLEPPFAEPYASPLDRWVRLALILIVSAALWLIIRAVLTQLGP